VNPATSLARTTRKGLVIAAALVGLVLIAAWRAPIWLSRSTRLPNILLITLDTTRADHLGAYGNVAAQTPTFDRLASEGVLFERAVSVAPITLPAHVSLLTGRYPFAHGVRNNGNFRVADDLPTLATTLHDRGYRTAAFVSAFVLDRRSGLSRGFDEYDDRFDAGGERTPNYEIERRGDRTGQLAENWVATQVGEAGKGTGRPPFFVWLHLYDPHDPYMPPAPFAERFRAHPYDGEIAFDDAVVGSIVDRLKRLGVASTTMVALVGDHGESLGEHGEVTHAMFVYEAALHVPMMVWWPGHLAPARVSSLVRGIDLVPTLLDLAGMPPLADVQGQSLLSLARGGRRGPVSAYSESYFPLFFMNWAALRSIQDDRWKFIDAPEAELYDLANDPHERSNLAAREPARAAALRRALDSVSGIGVGAMTTAKPDRDAVEKLAALGYIGATSASTVPSDGPTRADPKTKIGVFNRLRGANHAVTHGRPAEAETTARAVLEGDRQNAFAVLILAQAQMQQRQCPDAIASYRRYAALVPTSADAHYWIAICAARQGRPALALDEVSAALAIDPPYANARLLRAGLLTERGRLDEAASDYQQVIDQQPSNADAHSGYAVLLAARNEPERAIAEFERALAIRSDLDEARLALAGVLERAGRTQEARAEYQRLVGRATAEDVRRTALRRLAHVPER
jgi:arylsulfatase A-like enzyme/Tfp pilus assembly protein PilF